MSSGYSYAGGARRRRVDGLPELPPDLDPRGKHRTRGSHGGLRRWRAVSRVISAALSMFLLVAFGVYWWKYHAFDAGLKRLDVFGSSAIRPVHDIDGKDQNILIVGNDDRQTMTNAEVHELHTGRDGGSLNTDTMMIVHVPANGTRATLISLPRDSYVAIPGYGMAKLNSAYVDGYTNSGGSSDAKRAAGARLLVTTIQNLTGLTINHFVQVDLLGFYRISNAIGGIQVDMCNAVTDSYSGINLHKGINVIKGVQALAFVRQRHGLSGGDLDRVQRQRYFLTAAFRKLVSAGVILNPIKLQNLLTAVQSSMYLDAGLDPLALARQMENLSADNIVGKTIPTDGDNPNSPVGDVLVVNPTEVKAFIDKLIAPTDTKLVTARPVAPASVTVVVRNGGSVNGAASQNAAVLKQQGFTASVDPAPATSATTVIQYADGMQAQAKTLAQYVPGATLQETNVHTLTLLLGTDGLTARAKPVPVTSPTQAPKPKPAKAIDAGCIN